ncbi:ABC transporter permease [Larkinella soli]|uniref:ABC transporter permease n=1 Tax=Larkinella soli TaxID=1770527 RepID=UPI000FFBDDD3|nr:ABC transporter permease [Larkinella soli]
MKKPSTRPTPQGPPRWAARLLRWLTPAGLLEELQGDLQEQFSRRLEQVGPSRARWWYGREALKVIRPYYLRRRAAELAQLLIDRFRKRPDHYHSFLKPETHSSPVISLPMLRNHLKMAFRTLSRNKLYTALNMAGLAFGITCFLLVGLYLFDELTFDQQHGNAGRIYRVIQHKNQKGEVSTLAGGSYKLAAEAGKILTEVENTTRLSRPGRANLINPENPVNFQETITNADENFLQIFDFPLLLGDRKTALAEPNSIVINEELAMRLFGHTQVLGKTLEFSHLDAPLKVTGVLKNHPRNSSFNFNSLVSEATFRSSEFFRQTMAGDWSSTNFSVYVLLKPNTSAEAVSTKLTKLTLANFKPEVGTSLSFSLQALKDIHLYSEGITDGARNSNVEAMAQGSPFYIRIFWFIALFVLCIAGINYMNLSTARASNRLKEIGIRKSVGAERSALIYQFLVEALLITGLSAVLALVLVNVLLPFLNQLVDKQLSLGLGTDYRIWLMTLAATLLMGLLSGSYPALLLSGFRPVLLLKGMKINSQGSLSLRKALVVFQFTISTVLIIGTIVLFRQVQFMKTAHLGFNKNLLVVIDVNTGAARDHFETIKTSMTQIPSVKQVSVSSRVPGEWKTIRRVKINPQGKADDPQVAYLIGADKDFLNTFEVKLLQGRNFVNPADSTAVLLNETAARLLNITEPSDQPVEIPAMARGSEFEPVLIDNSPFKARVIGIVKDFHFQSLHDKIEPLVVAYHQNPIHGIDYYTARIDATGIPETLEKLKAVMMKADPDEPFEYHFLDQQLARFYVEDARRQTLLIWVALATIFIACLGLFGLATFSAEQRIKEIGVRKVLGASVADLATLLSMDFLKLVLIANGIAFPIAWWGTGQWLQGYAYHIDLEWWMFAGASLLAVGIALLTVSYQSIKAALANPVKSLRSE